MGAPLLACTPSRFWERRAVTVPALMCLPWLGSPHLPEGQAGSHSADLTVRNWQEMRSPASLASPLVFLQLEIISLKQNSFVIQAQSTTLFSSLLKFRFLYSLPPPSPATGLYSLKLCRETRASWEGISFAIAHPSLRYWSYSLGFRWSPGLFAHRS